jgi:hypothetical protein
MKSLALLLLSACLISCGTQPQSTAYTPPAKPELLLKVDEFKLTKGSNWNQNEVIEERLDKEFTDSLKKWIKQPDALDSLEFQLSSVEKVKHEGKMINAAVFRLHNVEKTTLDIMGIVPDELVEKLVTNNIYKITGTYIKKLEYPKAGLIVDEYSLGAYRFKIDKVK